MRGGNWFIEQEALGLEESFLFLERLYPLVIFKFILFK